VSNRAISIAALIWGTSIFLSRIIGLVREAVIGRTLGAGPDADVYWTAFVLPDFLNYLLAGGALSIVFIPIFQRQLSRHGETKARETFATLFSFLTLLLLLATLALHFAAPQLVALVAPGFSPAQLEQLTALTRIILPAQLFHILGGLFSAALQARDSHTVPAFAPLIYTLGIIAGGLLSPNAEGFAWGVLAGSIAGPFLLPMIACARHGLLPRPRWDMRHPDLLDYLARALPIMLGFSIIAVDDWILRREATLIDSGAASTITYAKNLMKVPMGVFGLALGVASFPTLARLVAEGQVAKMHYTLLGTLRTLFVLSFAAQAALSANATDLAALIYGRTRIDAEALQTIGALTTLVSIALAAWSAQTLLARGFYALGNTWIPAALGTFVALLCFPLYGLLREHYGLFGLAIASSLAILLYTFALNLLLERELARRGERVDGHWSPFFVRTLVALGLAIGLGRAVGWLLPGDSSLLMTGLRAALSCGSAAVGFLMAAAMLEVGEAHSLLRRVWRVRC
jgi:putative peptidoglycan lipid II flippase